MTGPEQVLIEDWCQQIPATRSAAWRSVRTAPSTSAPATARASTSRTMARTAARSTPAVTPRAGSARRCRHRLPRAARCAARICGRRRSDLARRRRISRRSGDRAGATGQPARVQLRSKRPSDRRSRFPQPLPDRRPAPHERGVGRRRRLEQLGGDRPHRSRRRRQELRLAVLRGQRPAVRLRRCQPEHLREPVRRPRTPSRLRTSARTTARWSSRARPARPEARLPQGSPSTRGQLPRLHRRALLR